MVHIFLLNMGKLRKLTGKTRLMIFSPRHFFVFLGGRGDFFRLHEHDPKQKGRLKN